jgi:hypothetical protein
MRRRQRKCIHKMRLNRERVLARKVDVLTKELNSLPLTQPIYPKYLELSQLLMALQRVRNIMQGYCFDYAPMRLSKNERAYIAYMDDYKDRVSRGIIP